jgi:hypothetical protein
VVATRSQLAVRTGSISNHFVFFVLVLIEFRRLSDWLSAVTVGARGHTMEELTRILDSARGAKKKKTYFLHCRLLLFAISMLLLWVLVVLLLLLCY